MLRELDGLVENGALWASAMHKLLLDLHRMPRPIVTGEEATREAVAITHVIDTHVHADHYSGGRMLAERGGALYCLHASNGDRVPYTFLPLHDQDIIPCGNVETQVLHTPGHTLDSISLLVTDNRRSPEPWFVLTGDTLFVCSIGRPDLAGAEQEMEALLIEHDAIKEPDGVQALID